MVDADKTTREEKQNCALKMAVAIVIDIVMCFFP